MKNFMKKHPYLLWPLIGVALLIIDFVYLWVTPNNDLNFPFIVLTAIGSSTLITVSPFVVYMIRKNRENATTRELSAYVVYLYSVKYRYTELVVCLLSVTVFLLGVMVAIYIGLPFLAPLSVYLGALIYCVWRKCILAIFYKVKNAEKNCELIKVQELSFLDTLYKNAAVTFIRKPEPEFLNLLYNRMNNLGLLKGKALKIYEVSSVDLKEKYGIDVVGYRDCFLCILPEAAYSFTDLLDYRLNSCLFDDLVDCRLDWISSDLCPLCEGEDDGRLYFATERDNGKVFLCCDGCGVCFDTPEDVLNQRASEKNYGRSRASTLEEIERAGWENYIRTDWKLWEDENERD